jgi:hypothetical protein
MAFIHKQVYYKFSDFTFKKVVYRSLTLFVFEFFTSVFSSVYAQFVIQYPAAAQGMTTCLNPSLLTVRVDVSVASTGNNVVTITLPPGVTYVPGSVTKTGGTPALTIADLGGTPSAPTFQLGPNTLAAGNFIIFTIQRQAGCASRTHALGGGTFKDNVSVTGTAGTTVENDPALNPYNVNFPSFVLTQPAPVTNAYVGPGHSFNRTFTITNGADGCADKVYFYIVYPGGGITQNSLTLSGFGPVTPSSVNGDTLFYTITGVGVLTADGLLCNGENLQFTENFRVNNCSPAPTQYRAGWGCSATPSAWCQTVSGSGTVSLATGTGFHNGFSRTFNPTPVDMCGTGNGGLHNVILTYNWGGTGNPVAATAYNVKLVTFGGTVGHCGSYLFSYVPTSFNINGNPIPVANITIISNDHCTVDLNNLFNVDPDGPGGLSDVDGDGFFDDLMPGRSVNLNFQWQTICSSPCYGPAIGNLNCAVSYNTMCGTPASTSPASIPNTGVNENFTGMSGYAPFNITEGVPFTVRLSVALITNGNSYDNSNTRYRYWMKLPPGVTPVPGSAKWTNGIYPNTNTAVPHTYTVSNDTLYILSPSNVLGYAHVDLVYNCAGGGNATSLSLPYGLKKINNILTGCRCGENKAGDTLYVETYCPTPCAGAGPVNYVPVVRRTDNSLGWTNGFMTTRQSVTNISAQDLAKALFLDTIQIRGSARQTNAANDLRLRLDLKRPNGVNALAPLDIYYEIWRSGAMLTSGTLTSSYDAGSADTTQRIAWNLNAALPPGGLLPNDSIYGVSRYVVAVNAGLPTNAVQTGLDWYYYNDSAGVAKYCNRFTPEMYLVGSQLIIPNFVNPLSALTPACDLVQSHPSTNTNHRRVFTHFASEFRPGMRIDSVQIVLPQGFQFHAIVYERFGGGNANYGGPSFNLNITTPDRVSGDTVTLVNNGSWLPWDIAGAAGNGNTGRLRLILRATCTAPGPPPHPTLGAISVFL